MPLIQEEQEVKKPSGQFLKLEDKSVVTLYSNLYSTKTHYFEDKKTSVICKGEKCALCSGGKAVTQYYYYGQVGTDEGIVKIPGSVFFAMNEAERVLDITKRDCTWVISKTGTGLETRYTVTRGKDITEKADLETANEKLEKIMDEQVKQLTLRYSEFVKE